MSRVNYFRVDLPVRIEPSTSGRVRMIIGAQGLHIIETDPKSAAGVIERVFRELGPDAFYRELEPRGEQLFRIVLDISDRALAGISWERIFFPAVRQMGHPDPEVTYWEPMWIIVRSCRVRPRFLTVPFTLPLRILQLGPDPAYPVGRWVRNIFGNLPQEEVDLAVRTAASETWTAPASWPTVDILHIDAVPALRWPELALSASEPNMPGTLGWFARWTERWQTRLVVLNCSSPKVAGTARTLAHALCDKGGPAVVVFEPKPGLDYRSFYDLLIHDFALDDAVVRSSPGVAALFGGSGREEGVRVSNVGVSLFELAAQTRAQDPAAPELFRFEREWQEWRFEMHEGEGLVPLSKSLMEMRTLRRDGGGARDAPLPTEPRFVNSSLWTGSGPDLNQLGQTGAVLDVGAVYQLEIQIGPHDASIRILDQEAIFEEVFKWSREKKGVWVEIGVAGIDFHVIGDPVQELWLPREEASEPLYFAVSPARPGVASLRFGLYYKNNLIQSFLLAAMTQEEGKPAGTAADLAAALRMPSDRREGEGYLARLEYSRTTDFAELEQKPGRALTITANELDGRSIFVTKGDDVFSAAVHPDNNIREIVKQIRSRLNEISYEPQEAAGTTPLYRFGPFRTDLEERCKAALQQLAVEGRSLYGNLAPSDADKKAIQELLDVDGRTIQIASILADKVVPWAFVYDAPYDDQKRKDAGRPVEHGVCLAWLDNQGEKVRTVGCGQHPECLLHPAVQQAREGDGKPLYHEETVVCPRHFWGFRHILEVPPRQKDGDNAAGSNEVTCIKPGGHVRFVAGMNASLGRYWEHWQDLCGIQMWPGPEYDRDDLLTALKDELLDFIYFYCHARGGEADPTVKPPYLEFQAKNEKPGIIKAVHLEAGPWRHRPLVFLNACGTLGYSPDALSPFLKTLVEGRYASGVLGTEVPVAEVLAGGVACAFITKFLKEGQRAGQALLEVRQALLAKFNPLGLVYTLYAPAELAMDLDGDGECQ